MAADKNKLSLTETDRSVHPRASSIRAREYTRARLRSIDPGRYFAAGNSARPAGGIASVRYTRLLGCIPIPLVRLHSPPVCASASLSVRPSVRSFICLSVCLSVVCCPRTLWTSASPSGPGEGSLTDYHLVFMVFEVLLKHLAASPLRVRLNPFPAFPLIPLLCMTPRRTSPPPSPPLAPTRRTRRPKGRKSARRGKVQTSDEDD